ncbi:MAG: NYN domain-containing protein [Pseudonocardiaceae bacterium]
MAIFIDFENLALGAAETLPGHANPVPAAALEVLCRDYGNASIRRAYADWARPPFGRHQQDLALNGIDLIQVTRFGAVQKNAADIRMAVDAMETLMVHTDVDQFVLVAGDGDYSPLVQRLREWGKHVIGVGTAASASRRLVSVCSEYKYWATLVASVDPAVRPAVESRFDIATAEALLLTALEHSSGPATAAWVKNKMLAMDPAFDEANYGCRSFRAFLAELHHLVRTEPANGDVTVVATGRAARGAANPAAGS